MFLPLTSHAGSLLAIVRTFRRGHLLTSLNIQPIHFCLYFPHHYCPFSFANSVLISECGFSANHFLGNALLDYSIYKIRISSVKILDNHVLNFLSHPFAPFKIQFLYANSGSRFPYADSLLDSAQVPCLLDHSPPEEHHYDTHP
jgi:hypothetical protein